MLTRPADLPSEGIPQNTVVFIRYSGGVYTVIFAKGSGRGHSAVIARSPEITEGRRSNPHFPPFAKGDEGGFDEDCFGATPLAKTIQSGGEILHFVQNDNPACVILGRVRHRRTTEESLWFAPRLSIAVFGFGFILYSPNPVRDNISSTTNRKRPVYIHTEAEAMAKLEELERVIDGLTEDDYRHFRRWFMERDWERWDREIEADSKAGKLDFLAKEALEAKKGKKLRSL